MMNLIKQGRAALSMLNPDEVRKRAGQEVHIGLVAPDAAAYSEMEAALLPRDMDRGVRPELLELVHRAGEPNAPERVDVVLYHHSVARDEGTFALDPRNPDALVSELMRHKEEFALPMARQFPGLRRAVVDRIVKAVARENALFAVATALPNVMPNLIELPWAVGEFASDTIFLTANQVRMAFLIAGACGKEIGFTHQKAELGGIVAAAFGWRTLARELAGKVPLGGGLIPKGAIAYAGTIAVGKGLEYYHHANIHMTPDQGEQVYRQALEEGRGVTESFRGTSPENPA